MTKPATDTARTDINAAFIERRRKRRTNAFNRFRLWRRRMVQRLQRLLYTPAARYHARRGTRFLTVSNPNRIGHLAAEIDWYLRKREMGELPAHRPVLLLRRERAANAALLDIWASQLPVVSAPLARRLREPLLLHDELRLDLGESVVALDGAADYPAMLARWGDRPGPASLPAEIRRRGHAQLRAWGLPEGSWFVCVHAREGGYSPKDEDLHAHRNSDIACYRLAIDEIRDRGGWCIRVGDPTMAPLDPREGVIDYANGPEKSDWLDLFLCAETRFFLGNTSGLCLVSTIFGRPSLLVNMIPYGAALGVAPGDLSIPKLIIRDGAPMTFPEIFASEIATYRLAGLYEEAGLAVRDNTPEEIGDAAAEMLDRLDGRFAETPEDVRRQRAFRALVRPEHYCYSAASRIGSRFLRQHADLLEPRA